MSQPPVPPGRLAHGGNPAMRAFRANQANPDRRVGLDRVAAHADQGRRVGVDGDGRLGTGVEDAVDVAGAEGEGGAGVGGTGERGVGRAGGDEALLADAAGDDGDGAGREVVVVEAGVVVVGASSVGGLIAMTGTSTPKA